MAEGSKKTPTMRKTRDFPSMLDIAREAGLDAGQLTDIISAFGLYIEDRMVGCAALKKHGGKYSIECLAVVESMRHKGLGRALVSRIEAEAEEDGAARLWAIARQPKFFERLGYNIGSGDEPGAPSVEGCRTCSQYRKSCWPEVVKKDLPSRPRG